MNKNTYQIKPSSIIPAIERLSERLQDTAGYGDAIEDFVAKKLHNVTFETQLSSGEMIWNFQVIETTEGKFFIVSAAQLSPAFDGRDKFEVANTVRDDWGDPVKQSEWFPKILGFLCELRGWAENGEVYGRNVQVDKSFS